MDCVDPRSTVILVVAFVNGCQVVALLPSMAAKAYWPGTIELSVSIVNEISVSFKIVLHCARFPGTRVPFVDLVGTTSDSPTFKVLHTYQLAPVELCAALNVLVSRLGIVCSDMHGRSRCTTLPADNGGIFCG